MHVALVTPAFPLERSGRHVGIERLAKELCDSLMSRGHNVTVVTTFWNGGPAQDCYKQSRVLRVGDTSTTFGRLGALGDAHHWSWSFGVGRLLRDQVRPDIVHALSPLASTPAITRERLPVVTTFYHPDPIWRLQDLLHRPFHRILESRAYLASTLLITSSQASARAVERIYGLPRGRIRVVYWGVDLARFRPRPTRISTETRLLYVGNLEPRKGIRYLLEAIAILHREGIPVRLMMVGGGAQLARLKRLAQNLAVSELVTFLGYVPDPTDERLPELYSKADVFVFPSLMEGFGFAPVEAMASGIPVVASAISALPEVIEDTGVLVPAKDSLALARAIKALAEDSEKRAELGRRGRERVERLFTWDKAMPSIISAYEEAIDLVR
jgi:glycosyltransferase involved in cell wall biosynthesis